MASGMERMVVNAAIEKLIAQTDEDGEAVRVVIAYGSKLQKSDKIRKEHISITRSSGENLSGYTAGQGTVTIKDKERDRYEEKFSGVYKDRVGYYRLWKDTEGVLCFHHFWVASITTMGIEAKPPDEYWLGYDPVSLEFKYLGILREKIKWRFKLFRTTYEVGHVYLESIKGNVPATTGTLRRRTTIS